MSSRNVITTTLSADPWVARTCPSVTQSRCCGIPRRREMDSRLPKSGEFAQGGSDGQRTSHLGLMNATRTLAPIDSLGPAAHLLGRKEVAGGWSLLALLRITHLMEVQA